LVHADSAVTILSNQDLEIKSWNTDYFSLSIFSFYDNIDNILNSIVDMVIFSNP
jgi:hypothetical protein